MKTFIVYDLYPVNIGLFFPIALKNSPYSILINVLYMKLLNWVIFIIFKCILALVIIICSILTPLTNYIAIYRQFNTFNACEKVLSLWHQIKSKMSTTKKFLKSKPVCKVTFKLDKGIAINASKVELLGDFNNWSPEVNVLEGAKDGSYKTTLDLETGKNYAYRFLIDGEKWVNDEAPDSFIDAGIGGERNSVVSL